jgi:hypothetical protein
MMHGAWWATETWPEGFKLVGFSVRHRGTLIDGKLRFWPGDYVPIYAPLTAAEQVALDALPEPQPLPIAADPPPPEPRPSLIRDEIRRLKKIWLYKHKMPPSVDGPWLDEMLFEDALHRVLMKDDAARYDTGMSLAQQKDEARSARRRRQKARERQATAPAASLRQRVREALTVAPEVSASKLAKHLGARKAAVLAEVRAIRGAP